MSKRLPRARALALWAAGASAAQVAIPLLLARRGPRYGWRDSRPGRLNRLGIIALGAGIFGLVRCYAEHDIDTADGAINVSLIPDALLRAGPYAISRNPMYVAEITMWLGWSVLFGSPVVLGAGAALAAGMRTAVMREERTLAERFGADWERYAREVPRWL